MNVNDERGYTSKLGKKARTPGVKDSKEKKKKA